MNNDKDTHLELEKLADTLRSIAKPALSAEHKELLKSQILQQLSEPSATRIPFSLQPVVDYIRTLVNNLSFDPLDKAVLKEKVFAVVESTAPKSFFWRNLFVFHKRVVSAFIMLFMVFGLFSFLQVDTAVVRAQTFTTLEVFFGDVAVQRGGEELSLYEGMEIYENDKIKTGKDGFAIVNYFDDSVTRLAGNSELVVNKLVQNLSKPFESYIQISLLDGAVWSRVLNLVGKDAAFVVEAKEVNASTKRAAFNVDIEEENVEVEVYNNTVDVKKESMVETVVSGKKAVVNKERVNVVALNESEKNLAWIQKNLENDKQYLVDVDERLLSARMESVGMHFEEDLSTSSSFLDDINLFLTFDEIKKQKKELDLAEKRFLEAEVKLYDPDLSEEERTLAQKAMQDFYDKVGGFDELVKDVATTDKEYSEELKGYLNEKVAAHKKDLSAVLPDSPLYGVKGSVDDLELSVADNDADKVELKKENAFTKLADAEDSVLLGDQQKADELVEEYKEQIFALNKDLAVVDIEVKKEVLAEVKNSKDLLAKIESSKGGQKPEEVSGDLAGEPVEEGVQDGEAVTAQPELSDKYGVTVEGDKALPPLLEF